WRPLPTPTGPVDDSRRCERAQRTAVRGVAYQLQRVVLRVLRAEEPQPENAVRVRRIVHGLERAVARRCDERTALDPLVEVVETRVGDARDALDEPTLRLVVDTFREWARDVGGHGVIYVRSEPCELFGRRVAVSIDVVRRSVPEGTVARVVLVVDNRLPERIYVDHGGRILVDGLAPDGRRKGLYWGGSSADTAAAGAGRTSRSPAFPAQLPEVDIPVVSGASLEISDVYATAYSKVTCRVPVHLPGGT
ncbi:MAG: hypothetical protein ACRDO2_12430, partial [Nocardioidaceae bacterium]